MAARRGDGEVVETKVCQARRSGLHSTRKRDFDFAEAAATAAISKSMAVQATQYEEAADSILCEDGSRFRSSQSKRSYSRNAKDHPYSWRGRDTIRLNRLPYCTAALFYRW